MDNHGYVQWCLIMPIHDLIINAYIHNSIMEYPQFNLRTGSTTIMDIHNLIIYSHPHISYGYQLFFQHTVLDASIIESWISIHDREF